MGRPATRQAKLNADMLKLVTFVKQQNNPFVRSLSDCIGDKARLRQLLNIIRKESICDFTGSKGDQYERIWINGKSQGFLDSGLSYSNFLYGNG